MKTKFKRIWRIWNTPMNEFPIHFGWFLLWSMTAVTTGTLLFGGFAGTVSYTVIVIIVVLGIPAYRELKKPN